ncbi:MAG: right-handed parallel beta-helix repeat-containing protein [Gemmataceae bacterium]|nr:right-handed parallel beta-helix repeat-containing protein [Gemmataceae bacterium]
MILPLWLHRWIRPAQLHPHKARRQPAARSRKGSFQPQVELLEDRAVPAGFTWTVNTASDLETLSPGSYYPFGTGGFPLSLRDAIQSAMLYPLPTGAVPTINFDIGDGLQVIKLDPLNGQPSHPGELPEIFKKLLIDGSAPPNHITPGSEQIVQIDGNSGAVDNGFTIDNLGSGTTIQNLYVMHFGVNGIYIINSGDTTQGGNYIYNNVISANGNDGIKIEKVAVADAGDDNVIRGNIIGLDPTGTTPMPNGFYGIEINGGLRNIIGAGTSPTFPANNIVGIVVTPESNASGIAVSTGTSGPTVSIGTRYVGNVISGNAAGGILLIGGADNNVIQGNSIGTQRDGLVLPNGGDGITILGSNDNTIGGVSSGIGDTDVGNTIWYNSGYGVHVIGGAGNYIQRNTFWQNGFEKAIEVDGTGNTLPPVNPPPPGTTTPPPATLTANLVGATYFPATTILRVGGEITGGDILANTNILVQYFSTPDSSLSGVGDIYEGQRFLQTRAFKTNAAGYADISTSISVLNPGTHITVNITPVDGALANTTAEMSLPATVSYGPLGSSDQLGVFRNGNWFLSYGLAGTVNAIVPFGAAGDVPVTGSWDASGFSKIGIFRNGTWYLSLDNKGWGAPGAQIQVFNYGAAGDIPIVGDWDGDGTTNIGVFRPGTGMFYLSVKGPADLNGNHDFNAGTSKIAQFGGLGDIPVVGDWNATQSAKFGVFRPSTGQWFLSYNLASYSAPQSVFHIINNYGAIGDKPVVGDWLTTWSTATLDAGYTGSGFTKVGLFRPSSGTWFLNNDNQDYGTGATTTQINYGANKDVPLIGRWDISQFFSQIGLFRAGDWFLNKNNTNFGTPGNTIQVLYGIPGDVPLVGDWV